MAVIPFCINRGIAIFQQVVTDRMADFVLLFQGTHTDLRQFTGTSHTGKGNHQCKQTPAHLSRTTRIQSRNEKADQRIQHKIVSGTYVHRREHIDDNNHRNACSHQQGQHQHADIPVFLPLLQNQNKRSQAQDANACQKEERLRMIRTQQIFDQCKTADGCLLQLCQRCNPDLPKDLVLIDLPHPHIEQSQEIGDRDAAGYQQGGLVRFPPARRQDPSQEFHTQDRTDHNRSLSDTLDTRAKRKNAGKRKDEKQPFEGTGKAPQIAAKGQKCRNAVAGIIAAHGKQQRPALIAMDCASAEQSNRYQQNNRSQSAFLFLQYGLHHPVVADYNQDSHHHTGSCHGSIQITGQTIQQRSQHRC